MSQQYTNELSPDVLAALNHSPFTERDLTTMSEEARALIDEQEDYARKHPVTEIYLLAVAGCKTRDGGTGDEFSTDPEEGHKVRLENGQWASVLTEGCTVTYPDGRQARIVTCAGSQFTGSNGKGVAVVKSQLDNGDEIISTPQGSGMIIWRDGVPVPDDFLTMPGA